MSCREQEALLALFNSFRPSRRVTSFDQLADGHVLVEVMNAIDGTHFKNSTKAARSSVSGMPSRDNWVLRLNILKRLYRLLLSYPLNAPNAPTLAVSSLPEPNFNAIAHNPKGADGAADLLLICRMCVAAGALGPANEKFIAKVQSLDETTMAELMKTIEGVMGTLPHGPDDGPAELSPPSSALRDERDRLLQENDDLRAKCDAMTEQVANLSVQVGDAKREAAARTSIESATARAAAGPTEADTLRSDLARAEYGLAETEAALEKQTSLVADLTKTVDELRSTAAEVTKLRDQVDEFRQVEERLHKSENVIEKYKKKLEDSSGLRRELRTLEEENAALIDKNSQLETEIRKLGAAKTMADNYKSHVEALERKANDHGAEFAQLTIQLEEAQGALADMERERDRLRDEIQLHQERVKELEGPAKRSEGLGNTSLEIELDSDNEDRQSKTDLRLRIRALERELETKVPGDKVALETLLAESNKARDRYQSDYIEANRATQYAQAKLEHILTGRGGDDAKTALALRQKLDEVLAERDTLAKDKQHAEVAHEELVRQLTAARADLGLVDLDKRDMIASARDAAKSETHQFGEQVASLKDELATLRERDRLHLEEIRRLMMDKIEMQTAGMEQSQEALDRERRLNDMRATFGTSAVSQSDLQSRNDVLTTEVASLSDKLTKARAFIKNQDALFRAEHKVSSGREVSPYMAQMAALKAELSVAKHNAKSLDSRYRLEQQLMLAAWHDLGARVVRDHVGAAGLRRPVVSRPTPTSWLAKQRKHQDDALFA